mmetsp:Transcript_32953/g.42350  ORF Transcript_32953/g.42350 Transcript_32953/m.42350 type:complete len:417 (-) Transcript_32953:117-1367(-)|eukprot:CAMPEP_0114350384 /NCGR_PEP_ID=MMETSP0101-20121206/16317_1 /TAXON_ID=38822 ORGANISM="Pteridomonas danica, Strain PT" /NCGR_SAMPLE_ID=MMETSP0101 /ASSEMBLY_ACC=CAM_ASM_000211 /LENGTH=416 /DNA_ID=CAMNT_0001489581 /DNA_START=878 /DNA_END=2128 /DNA_ORIENTATION=-
MAAALSQSSEVCASDYGATEIVAELPKFSPAATVIVSRAQEEALNRGASFVGTEHFLLSLLQQSASNPSRIFQYMDNKINKINILWKSQLLDVLEHLCGSSSFKKQAKGGDYPPFSPAMTEIFQIVKQISSGPVSDGNIIVYDGLVASEFLVAGLMLHGVNTGSEMLARGSKGLINSWSILEAINVKPETLHVNRNSVMQSSTFHKGPNPFLGSSGPFVLGDSKNKLPTISQLPTSPSENSNWLIPGRLVIGAKPSDEEALLLVEAGVTTFVSLIGEHSFSDYKNGSRRIHYPKIIDRASFLHFPIQDFEVPQLEKLQTFVLELKQRIVSGEVIFVHCRGGHGRTGTVVIPLVASLYDLEDEVATAFVNECTSTTRPSDRMYASHGWDVEMPETDEQRNATSSVNGAVRFKVRRKR